MTDLKMTLEDWLVQLVGTPDQDFLQQCVAQLAEGLMELEVSDIAGARRYERGGERTDYRNGYRSRLWQTRAGDIPLRIPKLRSQGYSPSFIEPRSRVEKAMFAVIQEAYIHGVSTRKVTEIAQAMGLSHVDKSRVSRICAELDESVGQWRNRDLSDINHPYLWIDAKYLKVRQGGRVVSKALVVAYAVRADGYRSILGCDLFSCESRGTWKSFLRSLKERGLHGVELVISDAHRGLVEAIEEELLGSTWQRCTVHFLRNMASHVAKKDRSALLTVLRSIFSQEDGSSAHARLASSAAALGERQPRVAELLREAEESVLAYFDFPSSHWRQIRSTNPLERLNKEIGRRSDVVGIFPDDASALRLLGAVLMEQDDEWQVSKRYMSLESITAIQNRKETPEVTVAAK